MKARGVLDTARRDRMMSEIFHELSQPLTTLECGLELAIRYDTTLPQVRHRLKVLLEAAQVLHQRFLELRAIQTAPVVGVRKSLLGSGKSSLD